MECAIATVRPHWIFAYVLIQHVEGIVSQLHSTQRIFKIHLHKYCTYVGGWCTPNLHLLFLLNTEVNSVPILCHQHVLNFGGTFKPSNAFVRKVDVVMTGWSSACCCIGLSSPWIPHRNLICSARGHGHNLKAISWICCEVTHDLRIQSLLLVLTWVVEHRMRSNVVVKLYGIGK